MFVSKSKSGGKTKKQNLKMDLEMEWTGSKRLIM